MGMVNGRHSRSRKLLLVRSTSESPIAVEICRDSGSHAEWRKTVRFEEVVSVR